MVSDPNRRALLRTALVTAAAALVGEGWARRWRPPAPTGPAMPIPDADALRPGEAASFDLPGAPDRGVVARLADGMLVAFDRRCTHLGCPVLWSAARAEFDCPCHRARFDGRTGRVLAGPPRRGLRPIPLEIRGARVWARTMPPDTPEA
jgi:nitrite reductase/ring-hydroxylating ferredoxin subunit